MTDHDAVLFDLDGVLVDSRLPFARGVNHALTSHGLAARPEHELHPYLGSPLHRTFRSLVGESACSADREDLLGRRDVVATRAGTPCGSGILRVR